MKKTTRKKEHWEDVVLIYLLHTFVFATRDANDNKMRDIVFWCYCNSPFFNLLLLYRDFLMVLNVYFLIQVAKGAWCLPVVTSYFAWQNEKSWGIPHSIFFMKGIILQVVVIPMFQKMESCSCGCSYTSLVPLCHQCHVVVVIIVLKN